MKVRDISFDKDGKLFCNSSGFPDPEISFERPNGTVSKDPNLPEKWPEYGTYRCTATNILGQSSMIKEIGGVDLIAIGKFMPKMIVTLTSPIGLPFHTPVAQKIADQR